MVERLAPARHDDAAPTRVREKRDPEATRQALVAAGASLFGEKGYDGVSIEDVALRAGVNKALISYHFRGKRGLYGEILAHGFREIAGAHGGGRGAARRTRRSPSTTLLQVFDAFRRERPEFPGLFMREVLSTGVEPRVAPHLVAIIGVVRRIAARGEREGIFRRVDPMLLHFGLIGPLVFFAATEPARRRAAAEHGFPFVMPRDAGVPGLPRGAHAARPRAGRATGRRPPAPAGPPAFPKAERSARMKRRVAVALPVLALSLAVAACRRGPDDGTIVASGHVEATEVMVSTKVAGTIETLAVDEGATVAAGQEIARLDTTDTRLALDAARAERAQAAAELRLRLAGSREEDVKEAEAQLVRAEADLGGAQKDLERMEGLLAAGSGTTKARDDARTRRDVAQASLDAARERLRRLKAGFRRRGEGRRAGPRRRGRGADRPARAAAEGRGHH